MGKYLRRKILIYILTFFFAVTINWAIPRMMPGDPISSLLARGGTRPEAYQTMYNYVSNVLGVNQPLWKQYLYYWRNLFRGDLGISIYLFPAKVSTIIKGAVPYDILLLLPTILISWFVGNKFGAFAARKKKLDNAVLPIWYILSATPYMWLGMLIAWGLGVVLGIFPLSGAYSYSMTPSFSWAFIKDFTYHWIMPFLSLFIVQLGGWAIGMRNMIIYELEADYSHYMETLGAPDKLVRKYAFRNAVLPQVTGLALQLGQIIAGAVATEMVFSYPGIGYIILQAINNADYFLIQGCFLFIVIAILFANFFIDIIYVLIDPRVRVGMSGDNA